MASKRDQRKQEVNFNIICLLNDEPSISTREIARRVGISNGAAHYCVTALVEKGYIKLKNFANSDHKIKYIYELTPRGVSAKAALMVEFLALKKEEYNHLKIEIQRLEKELGLESQDLPGHDRRSI